MGALRREFRRVCQEGGGRCAWEKWENRVAGRGWRKVEDEGDGVDDWRFVEAKKRGW